MAMTTGRVTAPGVKLAPGCSFAHALSAYAGPRLNASDANRIVGSVATLAFGRQSPKAGRAARTIVCAAKPHKVALLGAAGGIGQPLGLLLKMQPYVTELALYDIANVKGVAADLSHCNTPVQVKNKSWCRASTFQRCPAVQNYDVCEGH